MNPRSPSTRTDTLLRVQLAFGALLLALLLYVIHLVVVGNEPVYIAVSCSVLCVLFAIFAFFCLNPDMLRSRYTEETLFVASNMLDDLKEGLTAESAQKICERLLPQTRACSIAITDRQNVLACVGDMADDFPPGSPIHTPATHYVLEHGMTQSFTQTIGVKGESGVTRKIPAGIVAPLKIRNRTVGALKFYFSSPRAVNRTQYALVAGFSELLSTQLAIHALEQQEELTARAEVRALQAQINPHFLFNTLNTIASFTRTDPARARELLREFSSFYRSTLDNSGTLIPVEREIAQTKRYLTFELARFGEDRIRATFDVEDGVANMLVPAFVVQPLVENAVRHAMRDDEPLHIAVRVRSCEGNAITIQVSDDGVGMDEATANRLFNPNASPVDTKLPQGGGAGVAMGNISARIKRFYGPKSFARVDSQPGKGTTVTLHLDVLESIFVEG